MAFNKADVIANAQKFGPKQKVKLVFLPIKIE